MARIAGVDLPREKRVEIALTYIYGIGRPSANKILEKTGIDKDTKVNKLTETEVVRLRDAIEQEYKVEGDLRRDVTTNIKRLMDIGSYRGLEASEVPAASGTENPYQCEDPQGSPAGPHREEEREGIVK